MTKKALTVLLSGCALLAFSSVPQAQEIKRTEVKRADLTGTNMEVVVGIVELPPGASVPLHTHPGEEAFYVIEGGMARGLDGKDVTLATGSANINVRDVPHAGFKVTSDKPLKLLTVHIVDKGKPMTVPVKRD